MKTIKQSLSALTSLQPDSDPTVGGRRLASWELLALESEAAEFPEIRKVCQTYVTAGIRYTVALREASSEYSALMRDARP